MGLRPTKEVKTVGRPPHVILNGAAKTPIQQDGL